jgi:GrpB-like predicted nucleotidyltransferase (UPF0157 family)
MKIEVVPYNNDWPKMFESEKAIIEKALADNCSAVHHIGSTSVPGLSAKPKIDIIAVAKDRETAIKNLETAGYAHKGEWNIPLKCAFTKRENVKVNLHMFFDEDHPEIELNLKFRDYLRTHPDACNEYAALKIKILQDESAQKKVRNFPVYTIRKRKFIDEILKQTGFNRLRVLKCVTDDELNAAKNFRQQDVDLMQENLDVQNHEHFMLYHGVEIIGYAYIQILTESRAALRVFALAEENPDFASQFLSIIEKWLKVRGYENTQVESSGKKSIFL